MERPWSLYWHIHASYAIAWCCQRHKLDRKTYQENIFHNVPVKFFREIRLQANHHSIQQNQTSMFSFFGSTCLLIQVQQLKSAWRSLHVGISGILTKRIPLKFEKKYVRWVRWVSSKRLAYAGNMWTENRTSTSSVFVRPFTFKQWKVKRWERLPLCPRFKWW